MASRSKMVRCVGAKTAAEVGSVAKVQPVHDELPCAAAGQEAKCNSLNDSAEEALMGEAFVTLHEAKMTA